MLKYLDIIRSYLLDQKITIKRVILNFLFVFLILFYKDFFNLIIYKYLTPDVFSVNFIVFFVYILLLFIAVIGIWYKLYKDKYNFSINEVNTFLIVFFLLLNFNYFNNDKKWNLSCYLISDIEFSLSFLALFSLSIILFFIIRYNCLHRKKTKKIDITKNYLLSDSPLNDEDDDILDYQETVDKLTRILKNDNHNKSFTIGLVGPWGNGKSSVFQMVKKRLIKNDEGGKNDFITFDFLPYLNHNEDDIINEFFTSLSNELRPYSGKLSNLLNEYSSKLTDLYENKNVLGFIENHVTNFKDSSANELYQLINEMLIDIDKKIIVFVDDLDRLNKNEILQVLKLIRNTADFRNIIFVVAMDKEYVLKSLKKSKKIFHSSFIDKFFQLEIYLPEIDKTKLRENFILGMKSSPLNNGSPDFEFKILNAINNEGNLFNDYVKNIRDVKRLVNQVIYDYPNTGGEINLKDFLNFTYFKLKFPNFINILKYGIGDFIEIKHGLYKLKEFDPDNKKDDNSSRSDKIFSILSKQNSFDPKKYELYKEEFFNNCLLENQIIDCENRFLLIKTLAFLFGDENKVNDVSSIKDEKNLRILLEQKVPKNRLLNIEFEFLLSSSLDILINIVEEFHRDNKIDQLLSRFKFFTASKNENEYKNAILTLVYIFEKRKDFSIYEATIIDQIGVFAHKLVSKEEDEGLNKDIKQWSLENIFKKDFFYIETRILLFGHLRNGALGSKFEVTHWSFEKEELDDLALKLFQEYIDDCASLITNPNDYSLYYVYHTIKSGIESEVTKMIIEFWKKSNLELLCTQITDLDTWSSLSFKISDVIIEFFESKIKFIEFVKSHKDSDKNEIKDFLDLYKLLEITDFKHTCMFTFKKSNLMLEKIEHQKQFKRGKDENQELIQLVLESNSKNFINVIKSNTDLESKYGLRTYSFKDDKETLFYLFVYLKSTISKEPIRFFIKDMFQKSYPYFENWDKTKLHEENIVLSGKFITQEGSDNYMSIYSIEPKKDKTNINYESY